MVTWGVVTSKNEHSAYLLWERGAEKHEAQGHKAHGHVALL